MHVWDWVSLVTTLFWLWMLIDCLLNRSMKSGEKVGWFLLIFFTQIIGALIYFFNQCSQKNPIVALTSYYNSLKVWVQPQATPQAPPRPSQAAPSYTLYSQGYQAAQPVYTPSPADDVQITGSFSGSSEPQYEQTLVSYPELPSQH